MADSTSHDITVQQATGAQSSTDRRLPPGHYLTHVNVNIGAGGLPMLVSVVMKIANDFQTLVGGWIRGASAIATSGDLEWEGRIKIPPNAQLRFSIRNDTGSTQTAACWFVTEPP